MANVVGSQTYVEVAGVDVTSKVISWFSTERLTVLIDVATIVFAGDVETLVSLTNKSNVVIKRGKVTGSENVIFRGFIEVKRNDDLNVVVECQGKISQAARRQITNTYDKNNDPQAGVLSDIFEDIMETYAGLSFTVTDSSSYQGQLLDVYSCNRDFCLERCDELRQVLDWVIRWDYDNDIGLFEPKGTTVHPVVFRHNLTGGTTVHNTPVWERDSSSMVNEVEVVGRSQEEIHTQSFTASASQTVFTLDSTPGQTEVTVNGTKQVLGVPSSTETYDYTVQQHLKTVTFESAMSGGESVVINYGRLKPVSVTLQDPDSIDTYCPTDTVSGEKLPFQRTFKFEDVVTVPDAEVRAEELLEHYKDPLLNTIIEIDHQTTPVRAGMSVRAVDTVEGIDDFFFVTEIVHQWPTPVDIVNIGQERVFDKETELAIEDRLRKLERREVQNIDFINLRRDIEKVFRMYGCMIIYRRDTSVDGEWGRGFGDGVDDNELGWGGTDAVWQNSWTESNVIYSVGWSDNLSEEDFTDDELIDTATMTGTLDTSAATVTLTAGQTAIFGPCHLRIGGDQSTPTSITGVRVRLVSDQITSGSITTVEVKSSSGGSWETVTGDITTAIGATHTFTTPGIAVYVRLTSSGGAVLSGKDATSNKIVTALFTEAIF